MRASEPKVTDDQGRTVEFGNWAWLIALPLLFVATAVSVAALPFVWAAFQVRERLFARSMRSRERFMRWPQVETYLRAGEGTLIVEQAQKQPLRLWWTPEDVVNLAPVKPPSEDDLYLEPIHPFVAWCAERYSHPQRGTACLTEARLPRSPGFLRTDDVRLLYPAARVVATLKVA
jgi:hypothetical protein